ncbi:MAG: hypothetical protein JOZ70_12680, partial [Pseudolabrys sp.]|nr:hypothetical protein [Pseudolabrys sp.]
MSVLGAHSIATARTIEQKISDAGPFNQRVDPHVLTEVRNGLVAEGKLVRIHHANVPWFHLPDTDPALIAERLNVQLPVYQAINAGALSVRVGQALEIAVYKAFIKTGTAEFYGRFKDLDDHDDSTNYSKEEPPQHIGARSLPGNQNLDFLYRDPVAGFMGVECKNVREWLYPDRPELIDALRKCLALDCMPVLIGRRIPYVTYLLLTQCGAVCHQLYNQLLPAVEADLAARARDKTILGY